MLYNISMTLKGPAGKMWQVAAQRIASAGCSVAGSAQGIAPAWGDVAGKMWRAGQGRSAAPAHAKTGLSRPQMARQSLCLHKKG